MDTKETLRYAKGRVRKLRSAHCSVTAHCHSRNRCGTALLTYFFFNFIFHPPGNPFETVKVLYAALSVDATSALNLL
jgi:hypothetical protein